MPNNSPKTNALTMHTNAIFYLKLHLTFFDALRAFIYRASSGIFFSRGILGNKKGYIQ
jgi:hypothetical protein